MKLPLPLSTLAYRVRARKSPWIETYPAMDFGRIKSVRARKSPWIETEALSGESPVPPVRARKSPWIETV